MAARELKQIERQLILYDIFQQNDEDTRLSTIMFHLPGMNVRTLQRDIKDLTDAGLLQVCYHTACGGTNDNESLNSIFPYKLNCCILISRDASILQSTL